MISTHSAAPVHAVAGLILLLLGTAPTAHAQSGSVTLCKFEHIAHADGWQEQMGFWHPDFAAVDFDRLKKEAEKIVETSLRGREVGVYVMPVEMFGEGKAVYMQTNVRHPGTGNALSLLAYRNDLPPEQFSLPDVAQQFLAAGGVDLSPKDPLRDPRLRLVCGPALRRSTEYAAYFEAASESGRLIIQDQDASYGNIAADTGYGSALVPATAVVNVLEEARRGDGNRDRGRADEPQDRGARPMIPARKIVEGLSSNEVAAAEALPAAAEAAGLRASVSPLVEGVRVTPAGLVAAPSFAGDLRSLLEVITSLPADRREELIDVITSESTLNPAMLSELQARAGRAAGDQHDLPESLRGQVGLWDFTNVRGNGEALRSVARLSQAEPHPIVRTGIVSRGGTSSNDRINALNDWQQLLLLANKDSLEKVRGAEKSRKRLYQLVEDNPRADASGRSVRFEVVHDDKGSSLAEIRARAEGDYYEGQHVGLLVCSLNLPRLVETRDALLRGGALSVTLPIAPAGQNARSINLPLATMILTACRNDPALKDSLTPGMLLRGGVRSLRDRIDTVAKIEDSAERGAAVEALFGEFDEGVVRDALGLLGDNNPDPAGSSVWTRLKRLRRELKSYLDLWIEHVRYVPPTADPVVPT